MTREQERQLDPNLCAVLQRSGRRWRGLVVRLEPSGHSAARTPPRLIEAREFGPDSEKPGDEINQWIESHAAGQLVCVLHAPSVICRTCSLPDSSPEQLEAALRLQAEAHLLGVAPPHRLGMAVLDQAAGESSRMGMILAWPESAPVPETSDQLPVSREDIEFAPDLAGLARLIGDQRPAQPLLWVDRTDGSLAMAVSHPNGIAFRGLREDVEDAETWKTAVGRDIAETGLNYGYSSGFVQATVDSAQQWLDGIEQDDARCNISQDLIEHAAPQLQGATNDPEWWSKYGVLVGVVLARAGSLAPLTRLRATTPTEAPSLLNEVVDRLSRPSTARVAVVVCLMLLLFGPLMLNAARVGVLNLRHSDLDERVRHYHEVNNKLAIYREMRNSSWSMTKVLADIVNNAPEGIRLESIRINQNRIVNVRGRALEHERYESREIVTRMGSYLRDSGMFEDIALNWGDHDAYGAIQFDLSARVVAPYHLKDYPEERDFGILTLAERRYGPAAVADPGRPALDPHGVTVMDDSGDATDRRAHRDDRDSDIAADVDPRRSRTSDRTRPPSLSSPNDDAGIPGRDRERTVTRDIPEPLSESQIERMTEAEAREAAQQVSRAIGHARRGDDEELLERLRNEFRLLMDRWREARGDS